MKKIAAIFGVVLAMVLSGCAGGGGTVADPQKPWTALDAQRWNDPAATQVRWKPSDLDWKAGSNKSLADINEIAMELAYNTNWPTLVKFFEGVPPGRKDLRDEIFSKEVQGGHFRGSNPVEGWASKLALMSKNGDLSGQLWLQASQRGWSAWASVIERQENWQRTNTKRLDARSIPLEFVPVKRELINARGAWVVLWLAHQQALGNRALVDHLGEVWDGSSKFDLGKEALDSVGCGHHAYIAWMASNLRNLNWNGLGRETGVKPSYFFKVSGWPKSKCEALVENWPEYTQVQIQRFNGN